MNRLLLLKIVLTLGLLIIAGTTAAQCKQGDLVLTANGSTAYWGMFYTTWPGSLKSVHRGVTLNAVKMAYGNNYAYAIGTTTGNILRFSSNGFVVTIATLTPSGGAGLALDQDGSYVVVNFTLSRIYSVRGSSVSVLKTLSSTLGKPNAICRDGNSGSCIVGTVSGIGAGRLLRFDLLTRSFTTLSSSIGSVYGVDWIPQTGEYVVACMRGTRQYLSWVTSTGSIRSSYPLSYGNCVTVNQKTGQVFAGTSKGRVYEFTYGGSYKRYVYYGSGYLFSGIDIWGDQNVSVLTYTVQRSVRANLKFDQSPNKPYVVALSYGSRPGLPLTASHWLNLKPDTLFFLTLGGKLPYFTRYFAGTLNALGGANAYFVMPFTGSPIYVSAAALNPAFPAGLDIGNVEMVKNW